MKYAIGLDCGIASVGYSVMELDNNDEPRRIIKLGSRVFNRAENPKTGASLAAPRRDARGARRRIRRHKHRIDRIKYMMTRENVITEDELSHLFEGNLDDIYMIRTKALDEKITNEEFARVLIHIAQRRGFKSNRKNEAADKEAGKLLSAVSDNQILMKEHHYRTVGEMFFKDSKYADYKRNKGEDYSNTVSRDMIADEIHKIFLAQRQLGQGFASEQIENEYTDIVLSQRPFDLGPGAGNEHSPSPYAGDQIEKMIGTCSIFKKEQEKRAAKATYSFQCFSLWQNINNIRVESQGETRFLTDSERQSIFKLCHKSPSINYTRIRKELDLNSNCTFATLSYSDKSYEEVETKTKFEYLKSYHQMRKVLDKIKKGYISTLSFDELDVIGEVFTKYKNDAKIVEALKEGNIPEEIIPTLLNLPSFTKFGHISIKACKILIPFLEQGMTYDKACAAAGFELSSRNGEKSLLLPTKSDDFDDIPNPVVKRAISQTIKVVNCIIREEGHSPTYMNIELARELSKNFNDRKAIEKHNNDNRAYNEKIKDEITELFGTMNPTGMDIVKYKLWKEQDGICPYSQENIVLEKIFDFGYVDVDHIIPYSISYDDSYNNKVLTFAKENRQKGNRLPMQYLSGNKKDNFEIWVQNSVKNYKMKKNLLKQNIDKSDEENFKERNLKDTQYLSRFLYNYINDNLAFEDFENGGKIHVTSVNGAATSYMRKRWGINKIREDGDLHHAVDATVIACVTKSMIKKISEFSKYREVEYSDDNAYGSVALNKETGEFKHAFPYPYPCFRKELDARTTDHARENVLALHLPNYTAEDIDNVKNCFVSRMTNHKVTGIAHEDTIRSGREEGYTILKTALTTLKLVDGEIKNYYAPESDTLLYNALKSRLTAFGGDASKAFGDNFVMHKPLSNGGEGPVVKKVKLIEKSSLNVKARGDLGVAKNGSMVRIDIFNVKGDGYYFVPIYVSDTVKDELPNLACSRGKNGWKEMSDDNFLFSLYPNDLIKVVAKKDFKLILNFKESTLPKEKYVNDVLLYFNSANISTASITLINNDNSYFIEGFGIKSLIGIEKYTVDPIGNIQKVKREKRMTFKREN